ncbi:MAG: hypothetical protein K1X47_18185 [Cyclobacteriaceae bacterium]|nr:hypothetical protein [Cyclobacteriaceae bacterium]
MKIFTRTTLPDIHFNPIFRDLMLTIAVGMVVAIGLITMLMMLANNL